MNKEQKGFTLLEVVLFIAISGAILIGVILSTNGVISRQRYNDSVQNFADFLTNTYSKIVNVENPDGKGNKNTAIYGKMIVFSQKSGANDISVYDIIADAESWYIGESGLKILKNPYVSVESKTSYTTTWGATIENDEKGKLFSGIVVIIRSPVSGSISTFYTDKMEAEHSLQSYIGNFFPTKVDFCINSGDNLATRRDVRIANNGQNASAVQIIAEESDDSVCKK